MTYDSETRTIVIGENNGKKYIQPPRFKVNATLQIAIEQVKEIINLPQNKSKFKDGELILIECIGRDGNWIQCHASLYSNGDGIDIFATYSSVGPQGAMGIMGSQGVIGMSGPQGEAGVQGNLGAAGSQGARGEVGAQGNIGERGATGSQGARGEVGAQGERGEVGAQGAAGAQGTTTIIHIYEGEMQPGQQGEIGATGSQGAIGPRGPMGEQGPQGATGLQGPQGELGVQGAVGALGAQGAIGAEGAQGEIGVAGPQGELGVQGAVGALGAQGAIGAAGAQGEIGAAGVQGELGVQGEVGALGFQGTVGAAGAQGELGVQGDVGAVGPQGAAGLQGSTGTAGVVGATGELVPLSTADSSTAGYILGKNENSNGWNGTIYVSSAYFQNGVLYEGSDERWKNIVGNINVDLNDIESIPKVYYTMKSDESEKVQIGTIAQNLREMFPEIVSVGEDGFMSVAYDRLAIIALAAIDELNKKIKELDSKLK